MLTWEKTDYGLHFSFGSPLNVGETTRWAEDLKRLVPTMPDGFYVFVDMKDVDLLPVECKDIIHDAQIFCRANGMIRSVVILANDIATMQLKLLAKKTGIYTWERYIDASIHENWEELGMGWLMEEADPDLLPKSQPRVPHSSK